MEEHSGASMRWRCMPNAAGGGEPTMRNARRMAAAGPHALGAGRGWWSTACFQLMLSMLTRQASQLPHLSSCACRAEALIGAISRSRNRHCRRRHRCCRRRHRCYSYRCCQRKTLHPSSAARQETGMALVTLIHPLHKTCQAACTPHARTQTAPALVHSKGPHPSCTGENGEEGPPHVLLRR